jgi:hypothetical protein
METLVLADLPSGARGEVKVMEWVLWSLTLVAVILNCEEKAQGLAWKVDSGIARNLAVVSNIHGTIQFILY